MTDYLSRDVKLGLSVLPETAYNTIFSTAPDYEPIITKTAFYVLPQMEKTDDAGRIGNGTEFATYICNSYWSHPAVNINDDVNVDAAGRLLLRALGGPVVDTAAGTGTKHSAAMLPVAAGRQLPSSDFLSTLGGADFILAGMCVERYRLSQNRADVPQYSCDLIGSGKYVRPSAITLTGSAATIQCLTGNDVVLAWTDSGGRKTITAQGCRVRSWFVEIVNNLKQNDRCAGDPQLAEGTCAPAGYVRKLLRGSRAVTAQIVITLDSTVPEWIQMACNEILTDLTFTVNGPVIGAGPTKNSLEVVIPKSTIRATTSGDDNDDAVIALDFVAMYDPSTGGAATGSCTNSIATGFK
jgi:hypothetical protein